MPKLRSYTHPAFAEANAQPKRWDEYSRSKKERHERPLLIERRPVTDKLTGVPHTTSDCCRDMVLGL